MTALSPSATKVIIDEEEAEDEATPLKSFKEIEEEKEAEKKREQRFVNTSPLCVFIVFLRICTHYPPCYGGRYLFREIRRILIVFFLLHYLQLKLLSLCGPLDQNDALMLILYQIPETHIHTNIEFHKIHIYLLTKYRVHVPSFIPVQLHSPFNTFHEFYFTTFYTTRLQADVFAYPTYCDNYENSSCAVCTSNTSNVEH